MVGRKSGQRAEGRQGGRGWPLGSRENDSGKGPNCRTIPWGCLSKKQSRMPWGHHKTGSFLEPRAKAVVGTASPLGMPEPPNARESVRFGVVLYCPSTLTHLQISNLRTLSIASFTKEVVAWVSIWISSQERDETGRAGQGEKPGPDGTKHCYQPRSPCHLEFISSSK